MTIGDHTIVPNDVLGPLGLTIGSLLAVGALWWTVQRFLNDLRKDLDRCRTDHVETNKQIRELTLEGGILRGKLEILQAHSAPQVSIAEMTKAFMNALKASAP